MSPRLPRAFYRRDSVTVARALLGQRLVRVLDGVRLAGIITETEAYLGVEDKAAHSYGGRRTRRNESMYHDGGHAYVYFTYGMHFCVNVVCGRPGVPIAVLVRGIAPTEGVEVMRRRRTCRRDADLANGPGKLCQALAIDRNLDRADLVVSDELFIECVRSRAVPARRIRVGPRVGIGYAEEWIEKPLRFVLREKI